MGAASPGALFVAVDGGNSKTDLVLGTAAGEVLSYLRAGSSSPHLLGLAGAVGMLDSLLGQARVAAGLAPGVVLDRAEIYLAGADLPVEVAALTGAVASRGWARAHRVDNDTFALLRAGTDHADAVAVVCGAGVNCVARRRDGRTARFPALGDLSGDWGGGQHLARLALWHGIRGEDGRGPATALTAAVAAHFGLPTVEDVSVGVHLGEVPRERVPELAEVLFAVAAQGDAVARRVVQRQATEVVSMVAVAAQRLELAGTPFPVVLGGGVLAARHPLLHDAVVAGLRVRCPGATVTVPDQPPVAGAALLALDAFGAPAASGAALCAALAAPPVPVVR